MTRTATFKEGAVYTPHKELSLSPGNALTLPLKNTLERPLHSAFDGSSLRNSFTNDNTMFKNVQRRSMGRPTASQTVQQYLKSQKLRQMGNRSDHLGANFEGSPDRRVSFNVHEGLSSHRLPSLDPNQDPNSSSYVRSSYSQLLQNTPLKNDDRSNAAPLSMLDSPPQNHLGKDAHSNASRTVRKLLKIVSKGRSQSTEPAHLDYSFDRNEKNAADLLKRFYERFAISSRYIKQKALTPVVFTWK